MLLDILDGCLFVVHYVLLAILLVVVREVSCVEEVIFDAALVTS